MQQPEKEEPSRKGGLLCFIFGRYHSATDWIRR